MNRTKSKIIKNISLILVVIIVVICAFYVGKNSISTTEMPHSKSQTSHSEQQNQIWTCSMHPEIKQDHPGKCPICGMDLIPLSNGESQASTTDLKMSPTALKIANVQTIKVQKGAASKEIRLTGKVAFDPQYAFAQNTHISGRVEELYINNIGEYVQKGDKIAVIYSPELFATQKELLRAYHNKNENPAIYKAVKQKLKLWKISETQIKAIIDKDEPLELFPIYADHSGYVVQKNIDRGEHVEDGTDLFIISQLDNLWGVFDVYEKDVPFIKKGMKIDFSLIAIPGQLFQTSINFVEPVLNPETRTITARILIANKDHKFKPEMFLNGVVHANLSSNENRIIIPKSAVMWTGKKSVVYVKKEIDHQLNFEMRSVVLGPSLGDQFVVESGLKTGEEIVAQGTFSIDAAAQLAGKTSMMSRQEALNEGLSKTVRPLFDLYLKIKDDMIQDNFNKAKSDYLKLISKWHQLDWEQFSKDIQQQKGQINPQYTDKKYITGLTSITELRQAFLFDLSELFIQIAKTYKPYEEIYVLHCPMAEKKGTDWLSLEKEVQNPYYGSDMQNCGELIEIIR